MNEIKIGLIGGSGLATALASRNDGKRYETDTPFGKPSDVIVETAWSGLPVFFLSRHGPGHLLNPSVVPYRANIFALKELGCTHIIASGAVGSLREEYRPRDLVIPDQVIDKTSKRPATFFENAAVHVEFAEPFCPMLRQILVEAGTSLAESGFGSHVSGSGIHESRSPSPETLVHDRGCYVCMEGPAFSTRAESLMHRLWGGDLIGMTACPEAKLAREAEVSYATIALVTDYDSWRQKPPVTASSGTEAAREEKADPFVLLKEIIANLDAASNSAITLMQRTVGLIASRRSELRPSPAHEALKLAIWSDKAKIPRDEVKRLSPLWMKYFQG